MVACRRFIVPFPPLCTFEIFQDKKLTKLSLTDEPKDRRITYQLKL